MSDSIRREGTDGRPDQEAVGSGRHRRLPLSRLAALSVRAHEREAEAGHVGELEDIERHITFSGKFDPEAAAAGREKANEWVAEFRERADPRLLEWIDTMGVFTGFQLEPWEAWDDFRASVPTEVREAVDRLSDCGTGSQPLRG